MPVFSFLFHFVFSEPTLPLCPVFYSHTSMERQAGPILGKWAGQTLHAGELPTFTRRSFRIASSPNSLVLCGLGACPRLD